MFLVCDGLCALEGHGLERVGALLVERDERLRQLPAPVAPLAGLDAHQAAQAGVQHGGDDGGRGRGLGGGAAEQAPQVLVRRPPPAEHRSVRAFDHGDARCNQKV